MQFIKDMLKGAVIGIANILPGVSGGTMAVSMGIYDKLIRCVTHIKSEWKQSIKFLFPIIIGAGIGLVGLARVIEMMFKSLPAETNFLFIGLILGGLPAIWNNVKGKSIKIGHIIGFLAFFALVTGMAILGEVEGNEVAITVSVVGGIKMFFVGVIAAATMVIPGISGSMILLVLGYYNPILTEINMFLDALVARDIQALIRGCGIFIPFALGIIVGILVIAKCIEVVFAKAPLYAYWSILGLIIASPVGILLLANLGAFSVLHVMLSVVALAAGFFLAFKLGE